MLNHSKHYANIKTKTNKKNSNSIENFNKNLQCFLTKKIRCYKLILFQVNFEVVIILYYLITMFPLTTNGYLSRQAEIEAYNNSAQCKQLLS